MFIDVVLEFEVVSANIEVEHMSTTFQWNSLHIYLCKELRQEADTGVMLYKSQPKANVNSALKHDLILYIHILMFKYVIFPQ